MSRSTLPPELSGHAIRTSTGAEFGVGRKRLRAKDVDHPFHAVSSAGLDLGSVADLAAAFLPVMEAGQVFSHTTALALHGIPLPPLPLRLHVSVAFPRTPPRRPGIRGHSLKAAPSMLVRGLHLAPPADAWAQSAGFLSREELVAVADRLLFRDPVHADVLAATVAGWASRPGHHRLVWALAHARPGVRSRPESLLRLLLVAARLPEPIVEYPVPTAGGVVLHPDLAYPDRRLALEYEGDVHRTRGEWERDIERRELLADAGWRTIRVTARHLFHAPETVVARVRRHLAA